MPPTIPREMLLSIEETIRYIRNKMTEIVLRNYFYTYNI